MATSVLSSWIKQSKRLNICTTWSLNFVLVVLFSLYFGYIKSKYDVIEIRTLTSHRCVLVLRLDIHVVYRALEYVCNRFDHFYHIRMALIQDIKQN